MRNGWDPGGNGAEQRRKEKAKRKRQSCKINILVALEDEG